VRASARVFGLVLAASVVGTFVTGCETGRSNKRHSIAEAISDESTTGRQDPEVIGSGEGQPPVPGSPTAAGVDGKQPYDDAHARAGAGAEHGTAPPPGAQSKDKFERQ
jgi:hypothetical protein